MSAEPCFECCGRGWVYVLFIDRGFENFKRDCHRCWGSGVEPTQAVQPA